MRTTLNVDDELFAKVQQYAAIEERSALINEALRAALHRAATQRLKLLGVCKPSSKLPPQKRPSISKPCHVHLNQLASARLFRAELRTRHTRLAILANESAIRFTRYEFFDFQTVEHKYAS